MTVMGVSPLKILKKITMKKIVFLFKKKKGGGGDSYQKSFERVPDLLTLLFESFVICEVCIEKLSHFRTCVNIGVLSCKYLRGKSESTSKC